MVRPIEALREHQPRHLSGRLCGLARMHCICGVAMRHTSSSTSSSSGVVIGRRHCVARVEYRGTKGQSHGACVSYGLMGACARARCRSASKRVYRVWKYRRQCGGGGEDAGQHASIQSQSERHAGRCTRQMSRCGRCECSRGRVGTGGCAACEEEGPLGAGLCCSACKVHAHHHGVHSAPHRSIQKAAAMAQDPFDAPQRMHAQPQSSIQHR